MDLSCWKRTYSYPYTQSPLTPLSLFPIKTHYLPSTYEDLGQLVANLNRHL